MTRAAVVVVSYGSSDLLERDLSTLDAAAVPAEVVVVDCWTTADERARVSRLCDAHGWHLVGPDRNLGFAGGANAGAAAALRLGCDALVLLNPDAVASAATLAALAEQVRADPGCLVSARLLREDGTVWFRGSAVDLRTGDLRPGHHGGTSWPPDGTVDWLTGACLALHRDAWTRVGGFAEEFFLYWEDVDLSRRWVRAGGRLAVRHDLQVVHAVGATQGTGGSRAKSPLYVYWNCRNRLLFAGRHLGARGFARWVLLAPRAAWRILLRGGRRELLRRPSLLVSAVTGTVAGVAVGVRALLRRHPGPGEVGHWKGRWKSSS